MSADSPPRAVLAPRNRPNLMADRLGQSVNIGSMTKQQIDPAVKRRLHRLSTTVESATADRNEMICNLYAEGHSLRQIAEACGTITHSAVARIVKRERDE